jgi:site-specific DNA-methyltransferase (adenine-specific)
MKTFSISSIIVPPERQRKEFEINAMADLQASIERYGLLHPIVLRENVLVAGERRLRAVTDLHELGIEFYCDGASVPPGHIPYTDVSSLSPVEAMEAELEENIRRKDLTWQERTAATAALFRVRGMIAKEKGEPVPKLADIVGDVRSSASSGHVQSVQRDILLADHLNNPNIAKATSQVEAFKILKHEERAEKLRTLGASVGETFSAKMHQVFNADCFSWMAKASPEQFDVIITDPPYGMNAEDFGDAGGHTGSGHSYADDALVVTGLIARLPPELFRLAKPEAHLYLFCDLEWFKEWRASFAAAGWKVFRTPLIWHKPSAYRAPWPDQGPQRKYELILYAVKGERKTLRLGGDIITNGTDSNIGHNAQKPVNLYQDLLSRSALPGDTVFDPFAGSGPLVPAAHKQTCRAVCIEQDSTYYGMILNRLKELV